jgi:hypothetical protein
LVHPQDYVSEVFCFLDIVNDRVVSNYVFI